MKAHVEGIESFRPYSIVIKVESAEDQEAIRALTSISDITCVDSKVMRRVKLLLSDIHNVMTWAGLTP